MKKIRVAHIYKTSNVFMSGLHFDNTSYYFHIHALKRNPLLEVTHYSAENSFDTTKLKGKFDVIILADNLGIGIPKELEGIKSVDIPVIARCGDFHNAKKYDPIECHEKYKIDYYFNFMPESYFYKFYPKEFKYKVVILGLEPELYRTVNPFKDRIKNRILNSGAVGKNNWKSRIANRILNPKRSGWYFYKLRTMCNELPYVDHTGMIGNRYVNDDYPKLLSKYRAAIAATTFYPTIKYWETSAAGCLTFMEITEENDGKYLGYIDGKTSIFINEKNYRNKFTEYLSDPDNPKWEEIANQGRRYTMEELNNDKAVDRLVEVMQELL